MLTNCNTALNAIAGTLESFSARTAGWVARLDGLLPLSRAGLCAGLSGGALYALLSANHMIVQNPTDLYVVGLMLAAIGGAAGWLAGELLRGPLRAITEEQADIVSQEDTGVAASGARHSST